MQDSTAEQQERLRPRMASMASHEACHAAIASLRRGSFSSQSLTCGTSHVCTFAPTLTCRLDSYTERKVVGVGIEVRRLGNAERGRGAGRKSWILKNVMFMHWILRATLACAHLPRESSILKYYLRSVEHYQSAWRG